MSRASKAEVPGTLGLLAGGIAHDFNELSAIIGNISSPPSPPAE